MPKTAFLLLLMVLSSNPKQIFELFDNIQFPKKSEYTTQKQVHFHLFSCNFLFHKGEKTLIIFTSMPVLSVKPNISQEGDCCCKGPQHTDVNVKLKMRDNRLCWDLLDLTIIWKFESIWDSV